MSVHTIELEVTMQCPFRRYAPDRNDMVCKHPDSDGDYACGPSLHKPPETCPLRHGDTIIRLAERGV